MFWLPIDLRLTRAAAAAAISMLLMGTSDLRCEPVSPEMEQSILADARSMRGQAAFYEMQGRHKEAEALFIKAIELVESRLGKAHYDLPALRSQLTSLRRAQGRWEPSTASGLLSGDQAGGGDLVDLTERAKRSRELGRSKEAAALYNRALAIPNSDSGNRQTLLNGLGRTYFDQGAWEEAVENWQKGTDTAINAARGSAALSAQSLRYPDGHQDFSNNLEDFSGFVKAAFRIVAKAPIRRRELAERTFERAQWIISPEAARAVAQMAARAAPGNVDLSDLIRIRQDLTVEWQRIDDLRRASHKTAPDDEDGRKLYVSRLSDLDDRLAGIELRLEKEHHNHRPVVLPESTDVTTVRSILRENEVLIFILGTPRIGNLDEETFVWLVSKNEVRWRRAGLGPDALAREVAALRCGVDYSAWRTPDGACEQLLARSYSVSDRSAKRPLPFDVNRAYRLFRSLFGEDASFIKGKQLVYVPTGPMTQLPLQLLVSDAPTGNDFKTAAWLAKANAISTLPSVSSLPSLRRLAGQSRPTLPMIGFGNPLLDGPQSDPKLGSTYKAAADAARASGDCRTGQRLASSSQEYQRSAAYMPSRNGELADPGQLRRQSPLPETAEELCEIADQVRAKYEAIHLAARATEREVKSMSASGELARYGIVYFATHGVLPGQLRSGSEPGLILTPPAQPTDEDDGYLSAPEIAALRLDADWVVLSACNTAAGGREGNETLGGLARAFFYAQTRTLLVSHWAINSDSSVTLLTDVFRQMQERRGVGKSQALQIAMTNMLSSGREHPEYWAPFTLIGDGSLDNSAR